MRRVQMDEDFFLRAPHKEDSLTSPGPTRVARVEQVKGIRLDFDGFWEQEQQVQLRQPRLAELNQAINQVTPHMLQLPANHQQPT